MSVAVPVGASVQAGGNDVAVVVQVATQAAAAKRC